MAIRPKPQQQAAEESRIEALIERGGSVAVPETASRQKAKVGKLQLTQLRLLPDLVQRIDRTRSKKMVAPSRHSWILEAILEKLERDE